MSKREIQRIAPADGYPACQQNGITAFFQWVDFPDHDGGQSIRWLVHQDKNFKLIFIISKF
jgi:hypothetical protein